MTFLFFSRCLFKDVTSMVKSCVMIVCICVALRSIYLHIPHMSQPQLPYLVFRCSEVGVRSDVSPVRSGSRRIRGSVGILSAAASVLFTASYSVFNPVSRLFVEIQVVSFCVFLLKPCCVTVIIVCPLRGNVVASTLFLIFCRFLLFSFSV